MLSTSILNFLHANTKKILYSSYYRLRYLIIFILIGIISIIFKPQVRNFLIKLGANKIKSSIISSLYIEISKWK